MWSRELNQTERSHEKLLISVTTGLLFVLICPPGAIGAVIADNFDVDPQWTGVNNQNGFNAYGYTNTAVAGGSAGEVGGRFQRRAAESYYADTSIGGSFNLGAALFASGKFDSTNTAGMNNSVAVGHLSAAAGDRSVIGLGIFESNVNLATMIRVLPYVVLADGTGLFGTITNIPNNTASWFSYAYDPNAGVNSQGRLSLTVTNALGTTYSLLLDLTAADRAIGGNFDSWGMYAGPINDTAEFGEVYIDDVLYAAAEPEPTTVALLVTGGGVLLLRRRMRTG